MEKEILKPIEDIIINYTKSHPLLGWVLAVILIAFIVISFLAASIPKIEIIKSKILNPLAKKLKFKKLVKAAIESDVKGNLDLAAETLEYELPSKWVRKVEIEWVEKEDADDFIESESIVLRMRPLQDQGRNYATALFYFMKKIIFPNTKSVIPDNHVEATALYLAKRHLEASRPEVMKIFDNCILEPKIENRKNVLECMEKYRPLDSRGFYAGFFLREAEKVAEKSRFNNARYNVGSEVADILKHAKIFIDNKGSVDDYYWHHKGKLSSYAFILVAMPYKTEKTQPYVNRAMEKLELGIERIYLFGTEKEKLFVKEVIKEIELKTPLTLCECYKLHRDYRGKIGGIGALFTNIKK